MTDWIVVIRSLYNPMCNFIIVPPKSVNNNSYHVGVVNHYYYKRTNLVFIDVGLISVETFFVEF